MLGIRACQCVVLWAFVFSHISAVLVGFCTHTLVCLAAVCLIMLAFIRHCYFIHLLYAIFALRNICSNDASVVYPTLATERDW